MTYRLCQRHCGADRTIRLFYGVGGRSREIDSNRLDRLDRHGRTRATCRRGPSFRQLLLCECHYDENAVALPLAGEPRRATTALRFREAAGRRRSAARDRAADRAARGLQHAAILRSERRRTMRDGFFALIQFR
ncbi:hypothetical protein [Burkholderia ubonensis]|uniref:hypothetical protein n=1 Tax=Burkholderia ubonensis TaxID=101571 RepID=UPI0012FC4BEB|nr:hypothetical protein [Burkholderia ubonensis]